MDDVDVDVPKANKAFVPLGTTDPPHVQQDNQRETIGTNMYLVCPLQKITPKS